MTNRIVRSGKLLNRVPDRERPVHARIDSQTRNRWALFWLRPRQRFPIESNGFLLGLRSLTVYRKGNLRFLFLWSWVWKDRPLRPACPYARECPPGTFKQE